MPKKPRLIDVIRQAPVRILQNAAGLALAELKGFDTSDLMSKLPSLRSDAAAIQKASPALAHEYRHDFPYQMGTQYEAEEDLIRAYELHVWVYVCVGLIAESTAQLPLKQFKSKKGDRKDRKEVTDGPSIELFDRPNENLTGYDLKEAVSTCVELTGDAYIEKSRRARSGETAELNWLMPDRMKILPDPETGVRLYEYRAGGVPIRYDPQDIAHFKYFSPRTRLYGQAPGKAISTGALPLFFYAQTYNKNFFKQGARLSGAFSTEKEMGDDEFKRAKDELKEWYAGVGAMHQIALLTGGLKFEETGVTPKDVEFPGLYDLVLKEILASYGVYPLQVGILDKVTPNSNAKEQERAFYQHTLKPKLTKQQQVYDTILREFDPELFCEFDLSDVEALQEEEDKRSLRQRDDVKANIITINEVRADRGLEKVEWGDKPYYELAGASMLNLSDDDVEKALALQVLAKKKVIPRDWGKWAEKVNNHENKVFLKLKAEFARLQKDVLKGLEG